MKKRALTLLAASVMSLGMASPSYADGPLSDVGSFFGAVTATIIDVPQGMIVDSLYRCPLKTTKYLADKFGDENGLGQNVVGAMIGIPVGFTWGLPYGAIHGGRHGMTTGWEKPFSTESYIVTEEK
jgi:hypothetical protein